MMWSMHNILKKERKREREILQMCIVLGVYRGTISVGSALAFNCFQALSWIGSGEIQFSLEETFLSEILDISLALVTKH